MNARKCGPLHKIWFRAAAAAAILIGTLAGTYFLINKKSENPATNISKVKPADILPGTNKATLTLGNGTTMVLDSQSIGTLAQQGNTKIIKTDSGQLAYTIEKSNQASNKSVTYKLVTENILTTPRGGQYQLVLPDGTKVWLNAASSISYPTAFTGNQRLVKVTGEVYFEVVHNSKMPFVVKVGDQQINDIGTSFNVNAYKDEGSITTTLITGSVKIFKGTKSNILIPGQQEISSNKSESVTIKNNVDLDKVLAWRNGIFEFNNLDFKSIMRQVSRWYDVNIQYNTDPGTASFGGGISKQSSLLQVLHLLEGSGLHLTLENKTIIVNK